VSKGARKFVNPLTQPSTSPPTETVTLPDTNTSPQPSTLPSTLPLTDTSTETSPLPSTSPITEPSTYTSTSEPRKRGKQAFEHTHERVTLWLDKRLKKRFDTLSRKQELAKSTLLDEAIKDLLEKYQA
jgi:hypothetical protein